MITVQNLIIKSELFSNFNCETVNKKKLKNFKTWPRNFGSSWADIRVHRTRVHMSLTKLGCDLHPPHTCARGESLSPLKLLLIYE